MLFIKHKVNTMNCKMWLKDTITLCLFGFSYRPQIWYSMRKYTGELLIHVCVCVRACW